MHLPSLNSEADGKADCKITQSVCCSVASDTMRCCHFSGHFFSILQMNPKTLKTLQFIPLLNTQFMKLTSHLCYHVPPTSIFTNYGVTLVVYFPFLSILILIERVEVACWLSGIWASKLYILLIYWREEAYINPSRKSPSLPIIEYLEYIPR